MAAVNRQKYGKNIEAELRKAALSVASHEKVVAQSQARRKKAREGLLERTGARLSKFRKSLSMAYHGAGYQASKSKDTPRTKAVSKRLSSNLTPAEIAKLRGKK